MSSTAAFRQGIYQFEWARRVARWLGAVLVAAFAAVVRVLHLDQLEILLPVRTLFLQRRWAVTDFDPPHRLVGTNPRLIHIAQVFFPRDRAFAKCTALNRLQQRPPATACC